MGNLGYAIIVITLLIIGVGGIVAGYVFKIMSYPYANIILRIGSISFLTAIVLPIIISGRKTKNEEPLDDENILDRGI